MKLNYEKLDAEILDYLATGPHRLMYGVSSLLKEATVLAETHDQPSFLRKPPFRFIDNRLQALRKKGLITYSTKIGWALK